MAETTTVAIKVTADTNAASGSVKSFKAQLRDATSELVTMSEKFGVTSVEASNAAKKVAGLKDAIGDAKALAETFNPDKKFVALGGALQGAVGGFSALQGAMGLFGSEGKDVEKIMLKVQSVMALQQGISGLMSAKDSLELMKGEAVKAFQAIRAGIGSTGIGLFVLALGAIVMYWDKITEAVSGVSDEQRKLNDITDASIKKHKENLSNISAQEETLKRQGLTEQEILTLKIKEAELTLIDGKNKILIAEQTKQSQIEATIRNKEILAGVLRGVSAPLTLLLQGIDLAGKAFGQNFGLADKLFKGLSNLVFDPESTKKKGDETIEAEKKALIEMQGQLDGFKNQRDALNKADAEKAAAEQKKLDDAEKKRLDDLDKFRRDLQTSFNKDKAQALTEAEAEFAANEKAQQDQADREKSYADAAILNRQQATDRYLKNQADERAASLKTAQDKKDHLNMVLATTDQVAGLIDAIAGRQTATSKALGIATATINMYQGASEVIRAKSTIPEPFGTIQKIGSVAAILALGIKQVRGIVGVKVPGGGGGGGGSMPSAPSMPNAPLAPQAQSTRLDQGSINAIGQASARSYVLESDITSGQERIQRLNRAARIN